MSASQWKYTAFLVLAVVLVPLPFYSTPVITDWCLRLGTLMMLSISWNLAANAGLVSLGHSAFWGLGTYAAMLSANSLGVGFGVSLIPAIAIGMGMGALLAVITGRLRGFFFAISTLALSEGLRVIAVMTPEVTGGGEGLYIDQANRPGSQTIASAAIFCSFVLLAISWAMFRSRYHYAFRAMRSNEAASQMFGINPAAFRIAVLMISGGMASLAGGLNVWFGGFVDPAIAFDLHITIMAQVAPILGGIYTLLGPVIGAAVAIGISEATRIWFGVSGLSLLVYGVILCLCILYLPNGIWGAVTGRRKKPAGPRATMAENRS